jgi:muramoyltetrapeptide carboxypeptidase
MLKPRRLHPGDRIAVVAPASPFDRDEFARGIAELGRLGFEPVYDESVFARQGYVAGSAELRARALRQAWDDPSVAAVMAVRGGYGSVQLLPLLDSTLARQARKPFIGYSDLTSLLTWLTIHARLVAFHGPTVAGRLSRGEAGYDPVSLRRLLTEPVPAGELTGGEGLETLVPGEATGPLLGGNLTQLLAASGTPFAFDPPSGHVLFLEDLGERPYRIDRMLTQLRFSGVLRRAVAIVWGEMRGCDEPTGTPTARDVIVEGWADFPGPVLFGLPSGHSTGPALTVPLGVQARVVGRGSPRLVIEEAAVDA